MQADAQLVGAHLAEVHQAGRRGSDGREHSRRRRPRRRARFRVAGCFLPLLIFLPVLENLMKQLNVLLIGTAPDFVQAVSWMKS